MGQSAFFVVDFWLANGCGSLGEFSSEKVHPAARSLVELYAPGELDLYTHRLFMSGRYGEKDDESLEFGGVRISCAPFRFTSVVWLSAYLLYWDERWRAREKIGYSGQIFGCCFL